MQNLLLTSTRYSNNVKTSLLSYLYHARVLSLLMDVILFIPFFFSARESQQQEHPGHSWISPPCNDPKITLESFQLGRAK